jgi:hypothetical protein
MLNKIMSLFKPKPKLKPRIDRLFELLDTLGTWHNVEDVWNPQTHSFAHPELEGEFIAASILFFKPIKPADVMFHLQVADKIFDIPAQCVLIKDCSSILKNFEGMKR